MCVINTKNLSKSYGKSRGISDINLTIEKGEIFGFIGPNGAGKSTTIRTLLGLIKPSSGSATIFDKDITKHGPEIRERIGYLPSEVFYYDGIRAKDILRYSASFYSAPKKQMRARINELAERLDLDLSKKIEDMSYGNKKKVGIIQSLLHSSDLIILDEPTGRLDPLMQQTFFDILREEHTHGVTILFSSHILSEVRRLCDRVGIIKDGEFIAVEDVAKLRGRSYFKCHLTTATSTKESSFALPGISNLEIHGLSVSFMYRGGQQARPHAWLIPASGYLPRRARSRRNFHALLPKRQSIAMNVFFQEFRCMIRSTFFWAVMLIATVGVFIMVYPSFSHDIETSKRLIEGFPPQLRGALGLSLDSFSSFLGFYAYTFTYFALAAGIQASGIGLGILSREDRATSKLASAAEKTKYASVFSYFDTRDILANNTLSTLHIALIALIGLSLLIAAYVRFSRRDITI